MSTIKINKSQWEKIGKVAGWIEGEKTIHPLDRKCQSSVGEIPEENYYRSVWGRLVDIVASTKGVSEKDFKKREDIHKEIDSLLRNKNVMKVVALCERSNKRAEYCAELLFDRDATAILKTAAKARPFEHSTYTYFVNLDERGSFYADVRDSRGRTVYEIKAGDELPEGTTSIFEDGYMKHKYDLEGLRSYLVELGIMKHGQKLVRGN